MCFPRCFSAIIMTKVQREKCTSTICCKRVQFNHSLHLCLRLHRNHHPNNHHLNIRHHYLKSLSRVYHSCGHESYHDDLSGYNRAGDDHDDRANDDDHGVGRDDDHDDGCGDQSDILCMFHVH